MTREEALTEWIMPAIRRTWNEKKCYEILDAMEQEPCEDCISREAVLNLLENNHKTLFYTDSGYGYIKRSIENLPSVHPECTEDYCPAAFKPVECEYAVSREAALKSLTGDFWEDADTVLSRCYEKIKQLLPVTPQPKVGHWMQTSDFFINKSGQFVYQFICSECSTLSYFRKSNKKIIGADICPNCGSFNGGEQDGSISGTENP